MKKALLFTIALMGCLSAMAQQLALKGRVNGAKPGDSIEVNVSSDGFYWKKSSTYLKPGPAGNFRTVLPYNSPRFVQLLYKTATQYVLLSPNRDVTVLIDVTKADPNFSFAGKGKTENDLLKKLKLEDEANLPFVKELKEKNSYAGWSVDSVIRIKLPQIKHSLDSTQKLVQQAVLPPAIKNAISTELTYLYAGGVVNSLGNRLNIRKNRADFNLRFIDAAIAGFTVPSKQQLAVSVSANAYLDTYLKLKLWKAMYQFRSDKDSVHAAQVFKNDMGVAYADLAKDPDRSNEVYLFSTRIKATAPAYAWEKHLTNLLLSFCMQGQLQSAVKLLHFIRANCTDKENIAASEKIFAPLKLSRDKYASNLNIKIRPDYKKAAALKDLLAPYQGKVVFVDMWGTWCPHCIEDMVFEPALKERLKGKDIVFLYIARDEDADDEKWRDFIFINNLTGEHVRRTADQVAPLWNELGVPDTEQAYPHYFIFNKEGKMVENKAKRPSDEAGLYQQITKYL